MPDPLPLPEDDAAPPADPFEAELVAYLDGELEPIAARRVEARLATDPQARARASALKKTFDLLDYLPKPEPSATFTSRTLDRLPAVQPGQVAARVQSASAVLPRPQQQTARPVQPAAAAVASPPSQLPRPAARRRAATPRPTRPTRYGNPRRLLWATGMLVVAGGCAVAGYFGATALRSSPTPSLVGKENPDELPLSDRRVIENLLLYAPADDIEFVRELAKPDLFGDDDVVAFDPTLKATSVCVEKPTDTAFTALEKAFKALPADRQQAIRSLDHQLHVDAKGRLLLRVLEAYAVWLGHLSEGDRKAILDAAPSLRLGWIRDLRVQQWMDALPPTQKSQLVGLSTVQKYERIKPWRDEEARRREEWASIRRNPDAIAPYKYPWPFETDEKRKAVIEFARNAFRIDDTKEMKGCRLSANEFDRYTATLGYANSQGGSAWYAYGKTVYDLTKQHEATLREVLLPPPADPKYRYVEMGELPPQIKKAFDFFPGMKQKLDRAQVSGKWPEFPLEVHREVKMPKLPSVIPVSPLPPLGPARVDDFQAPVRMFSTELFNKLTPSEKRGLDNLIGKWPEYPREFIRLARSYDLSVPGLMLPGSQKQWDAVYGSRPSGKQ